MNETIKQKVIKYRGMFFQTITQSDKNFVKECESHMLEDLARNIESMKYEDIKYTREYSKRKKYKWKIIIEIKDLK